MLSFYQRVDVAAEYCKRWRALAGQQTIARSDAKHAGNWIGDDLGAMQKARPGQERELVVTLANTHEAEWPGDLPGHVPEAADAFQNRRENVERVGELERGRRPYGRRKRLEAEVAEIASREFGVRITAGYVRDCVEWFQALDFSSEDYQPSENYGVSED